MRLGNRYEPRLVGAALLAGSLIGAASGCGSSSNACVIGAADGCDDGLICEEVMGGEPACFAPLFVRGRVLDARTLRGIAGARVLAVDANGAARSTVVESAADGAYSLPVPAQRSSDGAPLDAQVTLRADAAGYQSFPTAPRTALPVELDAAARGADGVLAVENAATDIALIERAGLPASAARVEGTVVADDPGGVLVIAEQGGRAVGTATTADDGSFVLFDVPAGDTHIAGYRSGLDVGAVELTVVAPLTTGVSLGAVDGALTTVSGRVEIVNASGIGDTSVILVVESTFDEAVARGIAPPGLRAYPVNGPFSITGVAPGRYVVLAAFENDRLVRDPDQSIAGTDIVHIEVTAGQGSLAIPDSFKVTGALEVVSPGATGVEVISDASPTLVWRDDSSEDGYEIRIYDAFGTLLHEDTAVPRVTGSPTVEYAWTTASLEPGMLYQFRVLSFQDGRDGRTYISASEDLLGAFEFRPATP